MGARRERRGAARDSAGDHPLVEMEFRRAAAHDNPRRRVGVLPHGRKGGLFAPEDAGTRRGSHSDDGGFRPHVVLRHREHPEQQISGAHRGTDAIHNDAGAADVHLRALPQKRDAHRQHRIDPHGRGIRGAAHVAALLHPAAAGARCCSTSSSSGPTTYAPTCSESRWASTACSSASRPKSRGRDSSADSSERWRWDT